TADRSLVVEQDQIGDTIAVHVADGEPDDAADAGRSNHQIELTTLAVFEKMQVALRVEQGSIRIAVAVQISPCESTQSGDATKQLLTSPRSVAVVSERDGRAAVDADDDVEVAVHFEIGGPGSETVGVQRLAGSRRIGRRVAECSVCALQK